jgi:hypothetical protein
MKIRLTLRSGPDGTLGMDAKPEEIERLLKRSTDSPQASSLVAFLKALDMLVGEFNKPEDSIDSNETV